ncbi:MAG TPA: transglycosylase domain-containing protein, partial [Anaeromyxobacteraceae bacterium]|nr:transglycosylase domain-containing protein [Anaeromyxobacteraceae bacterium]
MGLGSDSARAGRARLRGRRLLRARSVRLARGERGGRRQLASGRALRGASTLSQQLTKNLWLGTDRSAWRKEAILAMKLERRVPKRRSTSTSRGGGRAFGAEAAARQRFGVAAAELSTAGRAPRGDAPRSPQGGPRQG